MTKAINGGDYQATTRLTNRQGEVLAEIGQTCEQVPAESRGWLVAQGLIVLKEASDGKA